MNIVAQRKKIGQRMQLFVIAAVLATSGIYGVLTSTPTVSAAIDRDSVAMHGQVIDTYDGQPIPFAWVDMGCGEGYGSVVQADENGDYTFTKGQIYDAVDMECPFAMGIGMWADHDDYDRGEEEWSEDRTGEEDLEEWEAWVDRNFTGQYFDFHLNGDGSQNNAVPAGFTHVDTQTVAAGSTLPVSDLQITGTGNDTLDLTLKADGGGTIDFTAVDGVAISGRGTDYVMLTGTRSDLNTVLTTMQYTAGSVGEVTIMAELGNNVGDVLWNDDETGNGHAYIVVSDTMSWHQAEAAARTYTFGGQTGYLATITSAQENEFIYSNLPPANRTGWLGATDEAVEGEWRWQTGPEVGEILDYTNWNVGEPNDSQGAEDCMQFVAGGLWNDISCSSPRPFVVEFGGDTLPQPTRSQFTINVTLTLSFDTQDGSAVAPITGVEEGQEVILPVPPVRAGYIFEAWTFDGDNYQPGDTFIVPGENVKFSASWEEDGNIDEIPDVTQGNVISLVDPTTSKRVTLELDASCTVASATILQASDLAVKDSAYKYDTGFVNFTATGCDNGKTTVNLYYYGTSADGLTVRKHNPNKNSYFTINDALLNKQTIAGQNVTIVSYEVVDGGDLDIDGLKNGTIVDPVGLGRLAVGVPNTGLGGQR